MQKRLYLLGAAALLALLYACGGGSGSSNSPTASSASSVSGTVTGFASLVIDGVEYDASKATFSKEVDPSSPTTGLTTADVEMGHHIDCDDEGGMLGACFIRPRVIGPIATITPTQFTVLGQTIDVSTATIFGGGYTGFASLMVGDTVEVHGTLNADGSIQATRVEKEMQSTPVYLVVGPVSGAMSGAMSGSFMINGLTVTYDSTTRLFPPSVTITNGQIVTVFSTKAPSTMGSTITLAATAIRVHFPGSLAGKTVLIGGRAHELVTDSMGNLTAFEVDELKVDASSGSLTVVTDGKPGTTKDITDGVRVLVLGTVNSSGTLAASEIWVRTTKTEALLAGFITAVDTTAQTFTVRHTTVDYSKLTSAQITNGTMADIKAGAFVVVTGTLSGMGVVADSLTFTPIPLGFVVGLPPIDFPPGWTGTMPPNPMLPPVSVSTYTGTVNNVVSTGSTTGSFTLSHDEKTVSVNETSTTVYKPDGKTIANVVDGSYVEVVGALNSAGSVDAMVIVIMERD